MGFLDFLKRKTPSDSNEGLVGAWRSVKSEDGVEPGEDITMTFTADGKLVYVIHLQDKDQIMNLVYRVDGSHLVTDQPSHPQEETTSFSIDADGHLVLDYDGNKSWFARA
jgi:hypothetical protein